MAPLRDGCRENESGGSGGRGCYAVALGVWVFLTVLCLAGILGQVLVAGRESLRRVAGTGPFSDIYVTMACVGIVWGLAGAMLVLLWKGWINRRNVLLVAGFFLVLLLYVNILRERGPYGGDVWAYWRAARQLSLGEHLEADYFYPPFWATLLQSVIPLGPHAVFATCWLLNIASLGVFYFLLRAVLRRYGFSETLSVIVVVLFLLVNVPVLRTLGYLQVNLHVMNLVLAGLLLYPRFRAASAAALATAVHLKFSPLVLACGFLLEKDRRWFLWFGLVLVLVLLVTVLVNGVSPYADFVGNVLGIWQSKPVTFRENSIDSWFRALEQFVGTSPAWTRGLVVVSKLLLVVVTGLIAYRCVRNRTFCDAPGPTALLNAAPALLILMMMASPLVWEHHPVFVSLAYLVLLKRLTGRVQWTVFGVAYMLEFVVPTFDFFPWSYGRLLSPLLWLFLAWRVSGRSGLSPWFERVNAWTVGAPEFAEQDDMQGTP